MCVRASNLAHPDTAILHHLAARFCQSGEMLCQGMHDRENFDRPAVIIEPDKMRQLVERDVTKLVQRQIPFRMHTSYNWAY